MEAFRTTASYYEVLSDAKGRLNREGPLLLKCLNDAPGPKVADLACGTGIHALFLAEAGAEVTALDLSPEMIEHASRKRSHPHIEYRVGDMRSLSGGPWDCIFCLGNSLSLVGAADEAATVFESVYASLLPGGVFVVQVLNYASAANQESRLRVEKRESDGHRITAVKSLVPQEDHTLLSLAFYDEAGGQYHSVSESAVLIHLAPDRLILFAHRAGFQTEPVLGAFSGEAYVPQKSSDVILIARKPA